MSNIVRDETYYKNKKNVVISLSFPTFYADT